MNQPQNPADASTPNAVAPPGAPVGNKSGPEAGTTHGMRAPAYEIEERNPRLEPDRLDALRSIVYASVAHLVVILAALSVAAGVLCLYLRLVVPAVCFALVFALCLGILARFRALIHQMTPLWERMRHAASLPMEVAA
jgi:hypothetical protein